MSRYASEKGNGRMIAITGASGYGGSRIAIMLSQSFRRLVLKVTIDGPASGWLQNTRKTQPVWVHSFPLDIPLAVDSYRQVNIPGAIRPVRVAPSWNRPPPIR